MKAQNAENPEQSKAADIFKWIVAFVLLAVAVVGNFWFSDISLAIRASGVVVLIALALGAAAMTSKGQKTIAFAKEARMEIRKVVWPTRQETIQTTFIVLAVCVVMSLVLWGIDGIMVRLVALATGI